MARRATKKKTAKKPAARHARPNDPAAAMRAALLELVATQGWRDLSLAEIAEAAGLDMATAHATYPTKAALLKGLARATDAEILDGLKVDPLDGTGKDRLFDLLMRRFDHLQQHRDAYATLLRELPTTPIEAAEMSCQVARSMSLTLETAGVSASGLRGLLRVQGLIAIYAAGLRAWRRDDSPDLSKTMAEIDKRLSQAVKITEMFEARRRAAA
ncbi:TetR family transcriptional regulator [Dongia sp.]|uniref:TetR family transcriptional regulator n=1 Tax=Dongia sp. TaxID=1977262 RepID=UPI0035AF0F69